MSMYICFSALILASAIFSYVNSQYAIRQYVVRRDVFTGIKAGEFSVYDTSERQMYYRIESNYALLQNIKLIAYPSKQEVGRLQAKIMPIFYKAQFLIFIPQINQWINGKIEQNLQIFGYSYNIDWNGQLIIMEIRTASPTARFRDANGQLLAQFTTRFNLNIPSRKYDMQIFSNNYPEQIYLLALAARDHNMSSKNKG